VKVANPSDRAVCGASALEPEHALLSTAPANPNATQKGERPVESVGGSFVIRG
jgi:hypothetical protein